MPVTVLLVVTAPLLLMAVGTTTVVGGIAVPSA